jgi:RimJ/RimL family protein N-acetyltransferase
MNPAVAVELRDVLDGDLPIFFEHQRDPEANRMAAFPARDREAFGAHWKRILIDPSVMTSTITADGDVAGNVVLFERGGRKLIGYWIGRPFWGRGIATRGLSLFLSRIEARPLHAFVAKSNVGSIRVLEKCGFQLEESLPAGEDGIEEFLMVLAA